MVTQEPEFKYVVSGTSVVFLPAWVFLLPYVTIVITVKSLNHKELTRMSSGSMSKEGA